MIGIIKLSRHRPCFLYNWIIVKPVSNGTVPTIDKELADKITDVKHVFDLRDPGQFFMEARSIKRRVIFHAGPTNSGKTHHAIQSYINAKSGIYCGPLRMLAGEIYRKTNKQGVGCDMITGEERLWADNDDNPSDHISCTVELCSVTKKYDVAVVDEIQMLRCFDRGWAWTRALLGVPAKEVHLCGEPSAISIVRKILSKTHDTLEIKLYDRLTPLKLAKKGLNGLDGVKPGDCIIAFSQRDIYKLRSFIEKNTNFKCAVIYGNLPSNVRLDQATQFNSGQRDVLVASDAIGMGMNLNIRRIVFSSLRKFDGTKVTGLTAHHTKQIAGRAGRYGSVYETGYVTTLKVDMMHKLKQLFHTSNKNIKKAGISPSFAQFELLSIALPHKKILDLMEVFEMLMELDKNYFLCDVDRFKFAWCVCGNKEVSERLVRKIIMWPPKHTPRSLKALQHLEYIHEVLDLYRWLSFRFEDIFTEREGVEALQVELERIITRAVDANLKHYKNLDRAQVRTRKRKRR